MNDLTLYLPDGIELRDLRVVADFDKYDEVMQRTVTLLLMGDYPELTMNGQTASELIRNATTGSVEAISSMLMSIGGEIQRLMNSDDGDPVVDSISISAEAAGTTVSVVINITKYSGESLSETLTITPA